MQHKDTIGVSGLIEISVKKDDGSQMLLWNENWLGKFLLHNLGIDVRLPFLTGNFGVKLVKNLIVTTGKAGAATRLVANTANPFTYIALGTGSTSPVAGNTTLETEITNSGLVREAGVVSYETTTTTNDTAVLTNTWEVTGSKALAEIGVLNATSTGTLLGRQTFGVINMTSGMELTVKYKFIIS